MLLNENAVLEIQVLFKYHKVAVNKLQLKTIKT